ncbi:MAG: L-histidine N(alpha)-methyltransferase, partial [Dolichospermum sp.]
LMTVLVDAGINPDHGTIKFSLKDDPNHQELTRINAQFEVETNIDLKLDDQIMHWKNGDQIQLFFSYRYTTAKLQNILKQYDIVILDYWEGANQEEGVYFCQKI